MKPKLGSVKAPPRPARAPGASAATKPAVAPPSRAGGLPSAPQWPADRVERRPLATLIPYARNARTHSDAQIAQLAASMKEWGWTMPVLVDDEGVLIAGHGRVLAAPRLGWTEAPVMVARDWTEAQKRAYRLADNRLALNAGWDQEMLGLELVDLRELAFDLDLLGLTVDEIDHAIGGKAGLTDPDAVPPVPEKPISQTGDLWRLGSHRLLCGDATSADDVARVLDGVQPHLMVTDPPYGVSLDPSWRDRAGVNTLACSGRGGQEYMDGGKMDIDARWDRVWALFPGDVFYVWCSAGPPLFDVRQSLVDTGFEIRQVLVWDKTILTLTRNHYWYTHEHCLYGVRKSKTTHWIGKAGQPSVWSVPSPKHIMGGSKEKNEPHPAQKPIECMRRPIENNSSPGQAVYDPFVGSGTTIIAAEMTDRVCHAIEIAAAYVDVAVQRWQAFTGEQAVLDSDGRSFDEIAAARHQTEIA